MHLNEKSLESGSFNPEGNVKEKKGKPLELVGPVTPKNPFKDAFWLVSSFTYSFWAHEFMLTQLSVYSCLFSSISLEALRIA